MTQSHTMKLTKYLISIVLLVILLCAQQQNVEAKNLYSQDDSSYNEEQLYDSNALAIPERDLRNIREVWAKIREAAINSWNYVKSVAEETKKKITIFVNNIKEQATDLKNKFEDKLDELKNRLNYIISDLYGTGELVKQCVKKEQENMEAILKEIIAQMGECIAEEINKLSGLNREEPHHSMNETNFIKELDDKIQICERDMQNVQQCLCKVREDIFDSFTDMENKILKMHFDSRSLIDDVKGTLVTCSLNNLIDATNLIATEMIEIAKCVLEAKEEESASET